MAAVTRGLAEGPAREEADWVVVEQTPMSPSDLLELKKRAWQLCVCKRKSHARAAHELSESVDEAMIKAFVAEIESLRDELSLSWTFFEEELMDGLHDQRLLDGGTGDVSLAEAKSGFESCISRTSDGFSYVSSRRISKHGKQIKLLGSSQNSPRQQPKVSPKSQALQPKQSPKARSMPPPEVWMAAKEHRRSNFLGLAIFPSREAGIETDNAESSRPRRQLLYGMLIGCGEVASAINLGMASRSFHSSILGEGEAGLESLWAAYGQGCFAGLGVATPAGATFAGDSGFRASAWARQRSFASRCLRGIAKPAQVVQVRDAPCAVGCLGPFVWDGAILSTLVFGDGRQNFHAVDVARRCVKDVVADRFHVCALRSSLGLHPLEVTASWLVGADARLWCCAASGVWSARPTPRGVLAKDASPAFQWVELPTFAPLASNSSVAPSCKSKTVAFPSICNSSLSASKTAALPSKPTASPAMKPAASPALKPAASPRPSSKSMSSPVTKPIMSPAMKPVASPKSPATRPVISPKLKVSNAPFPALVAVDVGEAEPLARCSIAQHQVASLTASASPYSASAVSASVEALWPLPGDRVLLLVQEGVAPSGSASVRRWLQIWGMPPKNTDAPCPPLPEFVACAPASEQVSVIDACSSFWPGAIFGVLLGLAISGDAELRLLRPSAGDSREQERFGVVQRFPGTPHIAAGSARSPRQVSAVLLRPASGYSGSRQLGGLQVENKHAVLDVAAIIAQSGSLVAHGPWGVTPLLPAEGFAAAPVIALRPVGAKSFAVCAGAFAFAFQATSEAPPRLAAVVALGQSMTSVAPVPVVSSFEATPYHFFVAPSLDAGSVLRDGALCCLWPTREDSFGSPKSSLEELIFHDVNDDTEVPECEELEEVSCVEADDNSDLSWAAVLEARRAICLKAWQVSPESGKLEAVESGVLAVPLSPLLFGGRRPPLVQQLVLEPRRRCLLALAASGFGISVTSWGVEASPLFERLRMKVQQLEEQEAEQERLEAVRRKLFRLKQRLSEIERLEEKKKEKGEEALSLEEQKKLQRQSQVQAEIEQLQCGLGDDIGGEHVVANGESEPDEEELERQHKAKALEKRREKESVKKVQGEHKRDRQKDREKCRELKTVWDA